MSRSRLTSIFAGFMLLAVIFSGNIPTVSAATIRAIPSAQTPSPWAIFTQYSNAKAAIKTPSALRVAAFTLELWFNWNGNGASILNSSSSGDGLPKVIPLFSKGRDQTEGNNTDFNYLLGISNNVLGADFEEGPGGPGPLGQNHPILGKTIISTNVWHHAAATYDGRTWNLYLDGNLEATQTFAQPIPPRSDGNQWPALGTTYDSSAAAVGFFQGTLDEAHIWNYARTQDEIRAAINTQIAGPLPGLIGAWPMNEGSGDINDVSGNGLTAILTSMTWTSAAAPMNLIPPALPPSPTGLSAAPVSPYAIDLSWTDAPDEIAYRLERSITGAAGSYSLLNVLPAGTTAASDGSLDPSSQYCYHLSAINGVGYSPFSEPACATTLAEEAHALAFDGASTYASFGDPYTLHLSQFTVETWFRRDGTGVPTSTDSLNGLASVIPLITKGALEKDGDTRDINFFLGIDADRNVLAADFEESAPSPGTNHPIRGLTAIQNGIWYHGAVTYDGSKLRLYLNGNLDAELAVNQVPRADSIQPAALATSLTSSVVDTANPVANAPKGFYDGALDEARIWNYARTPAQIADTLNAQISAPQPGLVARWGLNEGAGMQINSGAGTVVNGTIAGGAYTWLESNAPMNAVVSAPAAPLGLRAAPRSSSMVYIAWKDASNNETNFEIERSTSGPAGAFTPLVTQTFNAPFYENGGLVSTTQYCYRVRAVNGVGTSDYSNIACASPQLSLGYALDLGSNKAYVDLANPAALQLAQFTLETWFRRDAAGIAASGTDGLIPAIPLITKGTSEGDATVADMSYFLGIDSASNVLIADFEEGAGGADPGLNHPLHGVTPLINGMWYHAAATYDGDTMKLYLNGRLEASQFIGQPPRSDSTQRAALATSLTSGGTLPNGNFDGVLDETRIWNTALSQTEIQSRINTQVTSAQSNLAACWGLNSSSGTTVYPCTGTSISGTIHGTGSLWVESAPFGVIDLPPVALTPPTPADGATGVSNATTLSVQASDPNGDRLIVAFYGGTVSYQLIGTVADVASGGSASVDWPDLAGGQTYHWYVTVSDGDEIVTSPTWSFTTTGNSLPVAEGQAVTTPEDTPVDISLHATDADGTTPLLIITSQPAHGALALAMPGSLGDELPDLTYTPDPNFNGGDSFTFAASDGQGQSDPATVSITVTAVNDAPLAAGQSLAATENTPLGILLSASDVDGDALSYAIVAGPGNGALSEVTGASVTYTPDAGYAGEDSFTFKANDGALDSNTAAVTINISAAANSAPVARDDAAETDEDTPVSIDVLANDSDVDGDALTVSAVTQPANGAATIGNGGTGITYTPDPDYNGDESFTYTVSDGQGGTDTASVSVSVNAVNDAPEAVDDAASTAEDTSDSIDVLGNDSDIDGDALTVIAVTQPAHGNAAIETGGAGVTYTPNLNANGADSFSYTISDGHGGTASASVAVTITPVNDAPVLAAIGDHWVDEGNEISFTASATDVESAALTYSLEGAPAGASIGAASGVFTWTPTEAQGPMAYTFTVIVSDDGAPAESDSEEITITVNEVNSAPVLDPIQNAAIDEQVLFTFTATASDADLPQNSLTFSLIGAPGGAAIGAASGLFAWTPAEEQGPGSYPFTVRVTDSTGLYDEQIVTLTVNEVNAAPVLAAIGDRSINEGTQLTFTASATDADSSGLTYSLSGAPSGATIDPASGVFTWTPTEAQGPGQYAFTVVVTDNGTPAQSDSEGITVTVNEVNTPPVLASIGDRTVNELAILSFTASVTDADLPANTFTFSLIGAPAGAVINPTSGAFTWTPGEAQGPDDYSFTVRVTDSTFLYDEETITVHVNEVNTAPVLVDIANKTVNELQTLSFVVTASDADIPANTKTFSLTGETYGAAINATSGAFTWVPSEIQGPGDFSFTVRVSDNGVPALFAEKSFAVHVDEVNTAPVLHPGYTFNLTAIDEDTTSPEGDLLSAIIPDGAFSDADLPAAVEAIAVTAVVAPPESKWQYRLPGGSWIDFGAPAPAAARLLGPNARIRFIPGPNWNGETTFAFRAWDMSAGSEGGSADIRTNGDTTPYSSGSGTARITVNAVNDAPLASGQALTTNEETSKAILLSAIDVEGTPLTYSIVSHPANGILNGTPPNVTYVPNKDFNGLDSFSFRASDGELFSNTATIAIAVAAVNDPPVAAGQSVSTDEDTALPITLSATDVDGDALSFSIVAQPANGTLSGTAPAVTYTPDPDFNGADSFTFRAYDGTVNSATATVAITVNPVNDAPLATAQNVTTNEDTALPITLAGTDVEGSPLTYAIVTPPVNGALGGLSVSSVTYTPNANYNGNDSFTFKVNDGALDSAAATISITVNPVNDAPLATAQNVTTNEDTALPITLAGTDVEGSPLTYAIVTLPANGTLSGTPPAMTYTPNPDFNGADSFTFTANDGALDSSPAAVNISVNPVNDAPLAAGQSLVTNEDTSLPITLAATDVDLDTLTYTIVTPPAHGVFTGLAPDLTYTPAANYNGADSFTFKANDGTADSLPATINITVNPVNDAPVISTDAAFTLSSIQKGVTDPPGDVVSSFILSGAFSDADLPTALKAIAVIGVNNLFGTWQYTTDGAAWLDFTGVGDSSAVLLGDGPNDRVRFIPDPDYAGSVSPGLTFRAWDKSDGRTSGATGVDAHVNGGATSFSTETGTATLNVLPEVHPISVEAGPDQTAIESQQLDFSGSYTTAVGVDPANIVWDFGDGSPILSGVAGTAHHTFGEDGVFTVTYSVTNSDGAKASDSLQVSVANVAPALDAIADKNTIIGTSLQFPVSFTDPGIFDAHLVNVDWGDETSDLYAVEANVFQVAVEHTYASLGEYRVTITIGDDDGGQDSLSFFVQVSEPSQYVYIPLVTR